MIDAQVEIILIACLTAVACAIPGTFLVLRKMSMLSDAISHSILLGIVAAFFFVQRLDSPILVVAAGMTGVLTVVIVEAILKTGLVKEDAAIGVVYPFMFSIAVILISMFASHVHIDTDAVLMGELAFAPLNRLQFLGHDLGPMAAWQIGGIAILNIILTFIFYKELKLTIFDAGYAATAGFAPKRMMYGLMVMVSFTTVAAFEVAGAIMVVGFIVGPAVVASYFTKRLWSLLFLAPIVGIAACLLGYGTAHAFDVSIAGMIVTTIGLLFLLTFLFAPGTGVAAKAIKRRSFKTEFSINLLLVHLWQHEILGDAPDENSTATVSLHLNWSDEFAGGIIKQCMDKQLLGINTDRVLILLPGGRARAQKALER